MYKAIVTELQTEIKALYNKVKKVKTKALIISWATVLKIYGYRSYKEGRDSILGYLESPLVASLLEL